MLSGGVLVVLRSGVVLAVTWVSLAAGEPGAAPRLPDPSDHDGHGHSTVTLNPKDFTAPELERISALYSQIICACPNENWTKTLAGCPDGCADRQKQMVRDGVKAGKSDAQIINEQVRGYGTEQIRAQPDSVFSKTGPYIALGILGIVMGLVLARSVRKRGGVTPSGTLTAAPKHGDDASASDQIERDLEEMDR